MDRFPRKSPTLDLAEQIAEARRSGSTVYSLSTPTFPERNLHGPGKLRLKTGLTSGEGMGELRAVARSRLFGKWDSASHDCILSAGAKAAIFSILRARVPAGGKVLVVSPHWPSYDDLIELAGLEATYHHTSLEDGFRIDETAIRKVLAESGASAIICSNPGNPTGRILSEGEVGALCDAANAARAVLLLDESFSEIVFDEGKWRSSRHPLGSNAFVVGSFSKGYQLQGLRLGACLVPADWTAAIVAVHQALASAPATPSQMIALSIASSPRPVPDDYARQRKLILEFVGRAGWRFVAPEGGFHLFPRIDDANGFCDLLRRRGVLALPGPAFGKPYSGHVRVCFGKSCDELIELIRILDKVVKEHAAGKS